MNSDSIDVAHTALLLVDPYNDFLSEGGALWPRLAPIATSMRLHDHLRALWRAARASGLLRVVVPHHRATGDGLAAWVRPTPYQLAAAQMNLFARDGWGGEWHPDFVPQPGDVVASEHFGASGFANTDLDLQLRQRGITHVVVIGLVANTCIETTARYAVELGYHTTLVRDATAAFDASALHAAHEINAPNFAHVLTDTRTWLAVLERSVRSLAAHAPTAQPLASPSNVKTHH